MRRRPNVQRLVEDVDRDRLTDSYPLAGSASVCTGRELTQIRRRRLAERSQNPADYSVRGRTRMAAKERRFRVD
jgi:hypothetical protein